MVMKPVTSHAAIRRAGEFTSREISEETIKMPEPIIEPITSMVALVRPRPFTSSLSWWLWISQSLALGGLVSMLKGLLGTCGAGAFTRDQCRYFILRCGENPLLIFAVPESGRILPRRSPPPLRSPTGRWHD